MRSMKLPEVLAVVLALTGATASAQPAPSHAAAAPASVEPPLTDVTTGKTATLASRRTKLTLVNVWASWCQPCREEMPELDRLHRELSARGFSVVGVAADEATEIQAFLARLPVRYPLLAGDPDAVFAWSESLGNRAVGLPYSVLMDPTGRVLWRKSGGRLTRDEVLRTVEPLLEKTGEKR